MDNFKQFLKFYWRSLVIIFYPLVLLPIFLISNTPSNRCIYVLVLMAGFWLTGALPAAVTGLIPVALFPFMGILNSNSTSTTYITEASMLFLGAYLLAMAIEFSNLHLRVSLHLIELIGFSPRKLHVGLSVVTMFLSMWISNSATTALMLPLVNTLLKELETYGIGKMFETEGAVEQPNKSQDDEEIEQEVKVVETRKPTRTSMAFFISIAYSSTIGGCGYITGTPANLIYKGIYEITYPNLKIASNTWFMMGIPYMVLNMIFMLLWVQVLYMGLFRPNSSAAQEFKSTDQQKAIAQAYISEKLEGLGKISFHEIAVAICFILTVCLWITRSPHFFTGWGQFWTPYGITIKDASVVIAVIIIMFLIPKDPKCCYVFSADEEKRPNKHSVGLLTWKFALRKIPWGILFLIGSGFALAEGFTRTGLGERITHGMRMLMDFNYFALMAILALIIGLMTQLTSNAAVCSMVMPVLAVLSRAADVHPEYIMFPCCIATSFAYLTPFSTIPNTIVVEFINMSTYEMVKVGSVVLVFSYLILLAVFGGLLPLLIVVDRFPLSAYMPLD